MVHKILACLVGCWFPTWMQSVKEQLELSFCSNGSYRKETGNPDGSLGFTGYLWVFIPCVWCFSSTSVHSGPEFGPLVLCFSDIITAPSKLCSLRWRTLRPTGHNSLTSSECQLLIIKPKDWLGRCFWNFATKNFPSSANDLCPHPLPQDLRPQP